METMTEIRAALEGKKSEIAAGFAARVRRIFAELVASYGENLRGIYNSRDVHVFKATVSRFLSSETEAGRVVRYTLNDAKLAAYAAEVATATVEEWAGKIEAKLGDLDAVIVRNLHANDFLIVGTRDGRKVTIEQNMILNVSSRGILFNQWPARIYVDGKFVSEAKYRKLFA